MESLHSFIIFLPYVKIFLWWSQLYSFSNVRGIINAVNAGENLSMMCDSIPQLIIINAINGKLLVHHFLKVIQVT